MKRTLSEKRVLKKLGITDFRHMTKDKIVKFASMLPYMDPEVAKKALEQFPAFKDLAGDLVNQYRLVVDKAFDENKISQKAFYDACNNIISSLQKELEKEDINSDERDRIEDKMIKVAEMIGEKDSENKGFMLKILGGSFALLSFFGLAATSLLGGNSQSTQQDDLSVDNDNDDNTTNNNDIIDV